jgi:hypothetical protein
LGEGYTGKEELEKKVKFAVCITYMLHTLGKYLEGDLYFRDYIDKYKNNPTILPF